MTALTGLLAAALGDPAFTRTRDLARSGAAQVDGLDLTAPVALRPFAVAAVAADVDAGGAGHPVLAVTATTREADDLAAALGGLLARRPGRRLPVLGDAAARAALARAPTPSAGGWRCCAGWHTRRRPEAAARCGWSSRRSGRCCSRSSRGSATWSRCELATGGEAELEGVARRLTDMAYARVDLVTKRGEFAVRGGILDVFPPTDEHPSRVEFWGDEVEEIRTFAVADQRTIDAVRAALGAALPGAAAHPGGPGARRRAGAGAPRAGRDPGQARRGHPGGGDGVAGAGADRAGLAGAAARQHAGRHPRAALRPGADPHPGARPGPYLRRVPPGRLGRGRRRRPGPGRRRRRRVPDPRRGTRAPPPAASALVDALAVRARRGRAGADDQPWEDAPDEAAVAPDDSDRGDPVGPARPALPRRDRPGRRRPQAAGPATAGRVALVFEGHGPAQRAVEVLRDAGLGVDPRPTRRRPRPSRARPGHLRRAQPRLRRRGVAVRAAHRERHLRRPGRVHPGHAQDAEPAAQHHRPAGAQGRRLRRARAARHRPLRRAGAAHRQRRRARIPGHRVRRQQARPARRPALRPHRPARPALPLRRRRVARRCTRWAARTGRSPRPGPARRSREIAAQLIQLYAARQASKGHAFGPDTPWQRELEDAFPYRRRPTSWPRSTRSSGTWSSPSRWTG